MCEAKGKVHPSTGQRGSRGIALPFFQPWRTTQPLNPQERDPL